MAAAHSDQKPTILLEPPDDVWAWSARPPHSHFFSLKI
jgi:hypothetical protein